MAADFDSSDILGSATPVGKGRAAKTATFSYFFKMCIIGAATLLCLLLLQHGRVAFLRWKERHYKLSMRRKHGIPDHDQRPFNVAYAAARRAKEDSRRRQGNPTDNVSIDTAPLQAVSRTPQPVDISTTQRSLMPSTNVEYLRNRHTSAADANKVNGDRLQTYTNNISVLGASAASRPLSSSTRSLAHQQPHIPPISETGKNTPIPETYTDAPAADKSSSRNSREQDDTTTQDDLHESRDSSTGKPSPRFKRVAESGEDGDLESNEGRPDEKRRRKVSASHPMEVDDDTSDDNMELDEISDMKTLGRGKKRDRAEAGSTFGGDDELFMDEQDGKRAHRHRRRRHRKSSLLIRGQKRGRETDSVESDESDDHRRSRRRTTPQPRDSVTSAESDVSMDDILLSKDPLCKGRRVGDEWESHGVQFKVGPNGERLRKVLVKEDRRKFNMPVDSSHPDRAVNVTVIVERWYTEEAYLNAKEHRELAWQDEAKSPVEPQTPGDDSFYRDGNGKDLLWMSDSSRGSPVGKRGLSAQSVATNLGLRISSLVPTQQPPPGRRVSSLYNSTVMPPPEGSPKLRSSKSYSRWEKQEMEAEAMDRIRRKIEEEKAKKAAKEAEVALLTAPKAKAPAFTPSPLSFTKPVEAPSQKEGLALPAISMQTSAPTAEPKGKAAAPSAPSPFSFAAPAASSAQAPASTAEADKSKAPSGPASGAGPASPFSFAPAAPSTAPPPSGQPKPSVPTSSGSGIPNFFGIKGAATSSTPSTAPTTNAPPPAASTPEVKSPFSFGGAKDTGPSLGFGQQKPDQPSGPSLLNRMSQPSQFPSSSPAADTTKGTASPFGKPSETSVPGAQGHPTPSTGSDASSKPKFNFGFSGKSDSTPVTTAGAAPSGNVTSSFSFGPAKDKPTSTDSAKPAAPSPFGTPAAKSPFGGFGSGDNSNPFAPKPATPPTGGSVFGSTPAASTAAEAPKPVFSFKPTGSSAGKQPESSSTMTNPAGANTSGEKPKSAFFAPSGSGSMFGKPAAENATPAQPPAASSFSFGGFNPAPQSSGTTKPVFSFANNSASSTNDANKPASPFGTNAGTSAQPAKGSFGFTSTTNDANKPASPFGGAAASAGAKGAFSSGFGSTSNNATAPAPSMFGGAPSNAGTNPATEPAKNTSVFGSQSTTPSAFGFGKPASSSGSFTFGSSNAGQQSSNKPS
ncbi:hypothetical protein EVG20_g6 [Dentipellis fragilis]|uniref:Uncharacterized protein n=1 Tax=Dentipellis fragilis TaxID=205917 RepID=A0A4Y9ZED7_9AGAM|nr:hypothetical protein EVG20_g6 [Dentipellis fragilis]